MKKPEKLSEEDLAKSMQECTEWERDQQWIFRRFRFDAFTGSIAFVNQVAEMAEAMNHHPLIAIDYKHVTLRLTTWHSGGLTELDVAFALGANKLYGRVAVDEDGHMFTKGADA